MWIEEAPVPLAAVVEQMVDALIFADTKGQILQEEKALRQRLRELDP
jgi:hypothetical protein